MFNTATFGINMVEDIPGTVSPNRYSPFFIVNLFKQQTAQMFFFKCFKIKARKVVDSTTVYMLLIKHIFTFNFI